MTARLGIAWKEWGLGTSLILPDGTGYWIWQWQLGPFYLAIEPTQ